MDGHRCRFEASREDRHRLRILSRLEAYRSTTNVTLGAPGTLGKGILRCIEWSVGNGIKPEALSARSADRVEINAFLPVDAKAEYGYEPWQVGRLVQRALEHYFGGYRNSFGASLGHIQYREDRLPRRFVDRMNAEAFRTCQDHRNVRIAHLDEQMALAERILDTEHAAMVEVDLPTTPMFRERWARFDQRAEAAGLHPEVVFWEAARRIDAVASGERA